MGGLRMGWWCRWGWRWCMGWGWIVGWRWGGGGLVEGLAEVVAGLRAAGVSELVVLACGQWRAQRLAVDLDMALWATSEDVWVADDGRVLFGEAIVDGQGVLGVVTRAVPRALRRYTPLGEVFMGDRRRR